MRRLQNNLNDISEAATLLALQDVSVELIISLLGEKIGAGVYRSVYAYNLDNRYVVKVEPLNTESNMSEYIVWKEVQNLTGNLAWVKEWFSPILWCSPNGKILVQRRTQERPNKKRPEKVPAFFFDVKQDNFGWIGNKLVCHDYGILYGLISYSKKMKKVTWQ